MTPQVDYEDLLHNGEWSYGIVYPRRFRTFGMLTPFATLKRIGELYLAGQTMKSIAETVRLNPATVSRFIHRTDLQRMRPVKQKQTPESWQFKPSGKGSSR